MRISEIEETFKSIFREEEGLVNSVDTVYEKDDKGYKLVISIHGLTIDDTIIIHTKFIFRVDDNKSEIIDNMFLYLYDINCVYHRVDFKNIVDLKNKLEHIIESNDFGNDIKNLSDFIEAPATFLNHYLRQNKITEYSVFEVIYQPKFKMVPCNELTFDFDINISNNYNIALTIKKIDKSSEDDINRYYFYLKLMDETLKDESDTLMNLHITIGSNIAKILELKLQ